MRVYIYLLHNFVVLGIIINCTVWQIKVWRNYLEIFIVCTEYVTMLQVMWCRGRNPSMFCSGHYHVIIVVIFHYADMKLQRMKTWPHRQVNKKAEQLKISQRMQTKQLGSVFSEYANCISHSIRTSLSLSIKLFRFS